MIDIVSNDVPIAYLESALQATIVGMDIETSGLNVQAGVGKNGPYDEDRIACVQIYVPNCGTIMVRHFDDIPVHLAMLLESRRVTKIFQYAQFDLSFLMRDYPFITPRKICDTKVAADILDPHNQMFDHPVELDPITQKPKKSHSLIALVWHYFNELLDKETARTNWFSETLTQRQLEYAAKDVIYLPELLKRLENAIIDKNPLLVHELSAKYRDLPAKAMAQLKKKT